MSKRVECKTKCFIEKLATCLERFVSFVRMQSCQHVLHLHYIVKPSLGRPRANHTLGAGEAASKDIEICKSASQKRWFTFTKNADSCTMTNRSSTTPLYESRKTWYQLFHTRIRHVSFFHSISFWFMDGFRWTGSWSLRWLIHAWTVFSRYAIIRLWRSFKWNSSKEKKLFYHYSLQI